MFPKKSLFLLFLSATPALFLFVPAQQKKLQAVLRHISREFDAGRQYTEKQVNEIIGRFHADTASLRRAMIDYKLMQRKDGKYWRV